MNQFSAAAIFALIYGVAVIAFCWWLAGQKPSDETRKLFPTDKK